VNIGLAKAKRFNYLLHFFRENGCVAQLAEQRNHNPLVGGSSPLTATILKARSTSEWAFFIGVFGQPPLLRGLCCFWMIREDPVQHGKEVVRFWVKW
jgi:hypothetical protein